MVLEDGGGLWGVPGEAKGERESMSEERGRYGESGEFVDVDLPQDDPSWFGNGKGKRCKCVPVETFQAMREALEFYANVSTWYVSGDIWPIKRDTDETLHGSINTPGAKARAALKALEEGKSDAG